MQTLLPFLSPRCLTVLCLPAVGGDAVAELLAGLALRGPLTVLDGGNCFPAYRLLHFLRRGLPDPTEAARRIVVRRAFTCFQMFALLEESPAWPQPHVLLDPLATFYDEQVPEREVRRLLQGCLLQMERLAQAAPLVAVLPPARTAERLFLTELVCVRAGQVFTPEADDPPPVQPGLFPPAPAS
jgi:hypothetical protein